MNEGCWTQRFITPDCFLCVSNKVESTKMYFLFLSVCNTQIMLENYHLLALMNCEWQQPPTSLQLTLNRTRILTSLHHTTPEHSFGSTLDPISGRAIFEVVEAWRFCLRIIFLVKISRFSLERPWPQWPQKWLCQNFQNCIKLKHFSQQRGINHR